MFGTIVAQIALREVAKNDAIVAEHLDPPHFAFARPARRTISFGLLRFLCAPDRHANRDDDPGHRARHRDERAGLEDLRRIGVEREPPPEEGWRPEEHTSELQSLMRISYAVFCLKKKKT